MQTNTPAPANPTPASNPAPANAQDPQNPQNPQTPQSNNAPPNQQEGLDKFSDIWDDPKSKSAPAATGGEPARQAAQPTDPNTVNQNLKNYVQQQNLYADLDPQKLAKSLEEGNLDYLNTHLKTVFENAFEKMMLTTAQMGKEFMNKAVTEAVSKANTTISSGAAFSDLSEKLPFVENKAIRPVAEGILTQMLEKHDGDAKRAVRETIGFFKAFGSVINPQQPEASERFPFRQPSSVKDLMPNSATEANPSNSRSDGSVDFMALLKS
jgi:hypothetical protein